MLPTHVSVAIRLELAPTLRSIVVNRCAESTTYVAFRAARGVSFCKCRLKQKPTFAIDSRDFRSLIAMPTVRGGAHDWRRHLGATFQEPSFDTRWAKAWEMAPAADLCFCRPGRRAKVSDDARQLPHQSRLPRLR